MPSVATARKLMVDQKVSRGLVEGVRVRMRLDRVTKGQEKAGVIRTAHPLARDAPDRIAARDDHPGKMTMNAAKRQ